MANRLSQIATRTGDNGTTGLGDNTRVSKDSLRVHAMGDVDELNSQIGLLLLKDAPRQYLNRLSDLLFVLSRVLNRMNGGDDVYWKSERLAKQG